ncbi:hypothetical protein JXL19_03640 [bacterium]|nr:hypothetical protein [bacterium]
MINKLDSFGMVSHFPLFSCITDKTGNQSLRLQLLPDSGILQNHNDREGVFSFTFFARRFIYVLFYQFLPLFLLFFLSFFAIFLSCTPKPAMAGDYHVGSQNLYCSDCHTMHYSLDGGVPAEWGDEGPYSHLLKDLTNEMCLMCHDGTDPSAPNVMGESRYTPSAGRFSAANPGRQHSLGSADPPPGYQGYWNENPLSCVTCHDPHGNAYYRNLRPDPVATLNLTVTYETGAKETYGGESAIQQMVKTPVSQHYGVENILYRQSKSGGNYGLSAWCAGCHTDFYGHGGDVNMGGSPSGDTQANSTDTWIRHPTIGITLSEGVTNKHIDGDASSGLGYWWSGQILSRPPYISPSADIGSKSSSDNETGCASCHKAHGSDQDDCLIFDAPETADLEDGLRMVGTCQACHLIGGNDSSGTGIYVASPHGETVSGLQRLSGMPKGDCRQCHKQHAGNEYNLFTGNTNALCYTTDCHNFTPSGGAPPLGYPAQEEDRVPAGYEHTGYFEYFVSGERGAGLNNRVRWPGKEVYENPNTYVDPNISGYPERYFSPHGNDPDMPRKDPGGRGLCLNCHSPHGTDNPFDMLTKKYLGTEGSWQNDVPENYELCFSCHNPDDGLPGMDERSKIIERCYDKSINPNTAGHMIRKSSKSASYWPPHIQKGDMLACSNCHNPHGSRGNLNNNMPNARLLSDQRQGWNGLIDTITRASQCRKFCFGCHVPTDDPYGCSSNSAQCPKVDGIIMAPIPDLKSGKGHHESTGTSHCYSCHGRDYDTVSSASPAFNVHNPKPRPGHGPGPTTLLKNVGPAPPAGLTATAGKSLVELSWGEYTNADIRGYHLYRSQTPGGPYSLIASEPDTEKRYMDTDVQPEQNYYYVYTVEDMEGIESGYSQEAGATPMLLTSGQLQTLEEVKGLSARIEGDGILLSWEENMDELVAGYNVYRRMEGEETEWVKLTHKGHLKWPGYKDSQVIKGKVYLYTVVAVDGMGNEARFPVEVRIAYDALYIDSVSLSQGERPLRGGQEMVVTLAGSSSSKAFFDIEGLASHIPMEEAGSAGVYTGKYSVPSEIESAEAYVICFLEDSEGEVRFKSSQSKLRIDNVPPSPPPGLMASIDEDGGVNLKWDKDLKTDEGIASFRIYRGLDEKLIAGADWLIATDLPFVSHSEAGTQSKDFFEYRDITVKPETSYRYMITAVDEAGNESMPSQTVEAVLPPDIMPPFITGMEIIGGMEIWRHGETISIIMTGESGCTASFSIGGRIKDIAMMESSTKGRYEGRYIFQEDDAGEGMKITGSLVDPSGNSAKYISDLIISVVLASEGPAPEVFSVEEDSFQTGGGAGLVAGDILNINVRGTPGCSGVFYLGAKIEDENTFWIDWSGFMESEWAGISGYGIYKGSWPSSEIGDAASIATLGLGTRLYKLSEDPRIDPDSAVRVAALDLDGNPGVISTPKWDIPMVETEIPGEYKGEYKVQPGDMMIQGYFYVEMKDRFGKYSYPFQSPYTITIDTGSRIEVTPQPAEIKADSLSKSLVIIKLTDARGRVISGRDIGLSLFTTSEYTGLAGMGRLNNTDMGNQKNPLFGSDPGLDGIERYRFITDNFGHAEVEYQAGFAAKTAIFRARDLVSGDTGIGYCTLYLEAQAQVEQFIPVKRLKASGQQYYMTLNADPVWLTADGISRSTITASVYSVQNDSPAKGHNIVFSVSGSGRLLQQEAVTDAGGKARVTYMAGTQIGTDYITAVDVTPETRIQSQTFIILKSDAPAILLTSVYPERIPADGQSQCTIEISVTDINRNPSRGVGVSINVVSGGGKIVERDIVTDFTGKARAVYQSGTAAGPAFFNIRVTSKVPNGEELDKIKWAR